LTEKQLTGPLGPNATIGIVGGGQLGRMLAVAAAQLGFRTIVLEPGDNAPAAQVCNEHICAAYDDCGALAKLAQACDVVTYEFENVPLDAARFLDTKVPLYPPSRALEVSQDRLVEKTTLQEAGISVAPFATVSNSDDLQAALTKFEGGVLKTRRFGYDGKGQHVFNTAQDDGLEKIVSGLGGGLFVLEQKIDFISEFSVIAARAIDGSVRAFDPSTNVHEDGILRRSIVPANLSGQTAKDAMKIAGQILDTLNYVGVIGVEFFETRDGLLVNEFAPRVHNSGHWTHEACLVSQFEQHIRAITGMPLGSAARHSDCEMINLIGTDDLAPWLEDETAGITLYGKAEARAGRKMGHVTKLISR